MPLVLVVAALLPLTWAWGSSGHFVTAALAKSLLSPHTLLAIDRDLGVYSKLYPNESDVVNAADWYLHCMRLVPFGAPAA